MQLFEIRAKGFLHNIFGFFGLAFVPKVQRTWASCPSVFLPSDHPLPVDRSRHSIRTEHLDLTTANTPQHETQPQLTSVQRWSR